MDNKVETAAQVCPCCGGAARTMWAAEAQYHVVRCGSCALLYVHPLPATTAVDEAVRTGTQRIDGKSVNVRSRRIPRKVKIYARVLSGLFPDIWSAGVPIKWVDVGCGYGEVIQAVQSLAAAGNEVVGVEPMTHKADSARQLGLTVHNSYLGTDQFRANVVSAVDIFSHIPDFHGFLKTVATNLVDGGLLYLETGNLADLDKRNEFLGELGLPDHLVFCGEQQIKKYLDDAGFHIEKVLYARTDTVLDFIKTLIKKLLGRPVVLALPYTSKYRQLRIRARLVQQPRSA